MIIHPELKIKHIRELKNFNQDYIAKELNITTRAYSKIETGETQLTIKRLNQISEILDVDPMEILGFDEKNIFNNNVSCDYIKDYIGTNNVNVSEKLLEQYEETIVALKEQIVLLKQMLNQKK